MQMGTNGIPPSKDTGTAPLEVKAIGSLTSLDNGAYKEGFELRFDSMVFLRSTSIGS